MSSFDKEEEADSYSYGATNPRSYLFARPSIVATSYPARNRADSEGGCPIALCRKAYPDQFPYRGSALHVKDGPASQR